ncbi:MAG: amidase family protein [Spirochaetales bacterium]
MPDTPNQKKEGHVNGHFNDVFLDTSSLERYTSMLTDRNETLGAFIEFDATSATHSRPPSASSPLSGLPIAVKDNIAVAGLHLTCGSRLLEDYRCPYDATAVSRLKAAGATVVGKTALDEFGMGSATDTSSFTDCRNPWDTTRTAGGSSGGSAASVAAGMVPAALGSDTGGSIRQPAGFCGVYGLKPTYGAVSRYGLVAYASSLDTIGVLADTPSRVGQVFEAIRGRDERDQTSGGPPESSGESEASLEGRSIGVLAGALELDPGVDAVYRETIERLRGHGADIVEISLDCLDYAAAVYYTIAVAEASSNLARFDGVRYGRRPEYAENPEEMTRLARSEGLGDEVKLRILLGTFVLRSGFHDQYYGRAQRLRRRIMAELDGVFSRCTALLAPTFPTTAFPLGESGPDGLARKQADRFTSLANLAGLPSLAFPAGMADQTYRAIGSAPKRETAARGDGSNASADSRNPANARRLPVGLQLSGPAWSEPSLLRIAELLHNEREPETPPDYPREWA